MSDLTAEHKKIISTLRGLGKFDEFLGAFIFGSFARKQATANSDVDVKIMTHDRLYCRKKNINHPFIFGRKMDLSFNSISILKQDTDKEIKDSSRIPMIAESIILFDKTGELRELKKLARRKKPKRIKKKDFLWTKFMIEHMDDKAKRNLNIDPLASMLAMSINLNELIKYHYQINQKWWLSNKRLLQDLRIWDLKFAKMIEDFLLQVDAKRKYKIWTRMVDYVADPIGGRMPISENNCTCTNCQRLLELVNVSITSKS